MCRSIINDLDEFFILIFLSICAMEFSTYSDFAFSPTTEERDPRFFFSLSLSYSTHSGDFRNRPN